MDMISWLENYSVNNFLLDAQHKKLVSIINMLHSAMKEGQAKNMLEIILDDLILYTNEHFRTEERMMMNANFPGLKEHRIAHEKLNDKVLEFQKRFRENEVLISMDLMNFLKNWLINHIEITDKKYKGKFS